MQISYPKAPADGVKILRPALQDALQTQGFGINRSFARAVPGKISLSEPYRGYSLSLDDLAQGKGLSAATAGDWHYLVFSDGVTIADAQLTEVSGQLQFSALNHGGMATATVNALTIAENSAQLQGKNFELRLLLVSALHVAAIWLHGNDEEVLLPIVPTPTALLAPQLYDEATLLALLIPAAQQAKQVFDTDPRGLSGN
ncbi:MAG: hypothetical protein ACRC5A_15710 [Enterobacteriaceae bacterium]